MTIGRSPKGFSDMVKIAIVGGGPGGLMAAWNVRRKIGDMAKVTIFEASNRLGGKVLSRRFKSAPALYEAGVAEIYDYSMIGPDPLRELIEDTLGLATVGMDSDAVAMDGELMNDLGAVRAKYGDRTADAIQAFRRRCGMMMSPMQYYEGASKDDNNHPWAGISQEELLEREVQDPAAKRFFKVMARSDVASEPHVTNGLNALKNFVMDIDGYIGLYSIVGGNERLIDGLKQQIDAEIRFDHRVRRIGRAEDGTYRLTVQAGETLQSEHFDLVIVALPHNWLGTMQWEGERLRTAMVEHVAHFDRPAHYFRISCLFKSPFWQQHLKGAWFMTDAFGGCCVYDEGARHDVGSHGVLNWLVAGSDVLAFGNLDKESLAEEAIRSLPTALQAEARAQLIEVETHAWLASVNAIPGGLPVRDPKSNHLPEPVEHPGLFLIGDYLFDSTLNGLLDSADVATDMLLSQLMAIRYASGACRESAAIDNIMLPPPSEKIDRVYFERYRGVGPYAETWSRFSDPDLILKQIDQVWGARKRKIRMLVAGSASGELVQALRERGVDAWGVENNRFIHARTPEAVKRYNKFGSVLDLPFDDDYFDFVYETCLCHVSPRRVDGAIEELHRVAKTGVIFASVTSDLTSDVIDDFDLLRGVKTLSTWWEWSERFFEAGFGLALEEIENLDALWAMAEAAGKGAGKWYEDAESLRYCFFTKLDEEAEEGAGEADHTADNVQALPVRDIRLIRPRSAAANNRAPRRRDDVVTLEPAKASG